MVKISLVPKNTFDFMTKVKNKRKFCQLIKVMFTAISTLLFGKFLYTIEKL